MTSQPACVLSATILFANPISLTNAVANASLIWGASAYAIWQIARPSSVPGLPGPPKSWRTLTTGRYPNFTSWAAVVAGGLWVLYWAVLKLSERTPTVIPSPLRPSLLSLSVWRITRDCEENLPRAIGGASMVNARTPLIAEAFLSSSVGT